MHLPVLERADVEGAACLREDAVPVLERLVQRKRGGSKLFCPLRIWGDEDGKVLGLFAVASDVVEQLDDMSVVLAGFVGEIPALEGRMVAVSLHHLVDEGLVEIDLFPP